jgi:hypothetical protein
MAIVKAIVREMPNGSAHRVLPFHLSLEGLEKAIICRDEEDYDILVKYVFLCALSKNISVVTYVVVSNHMHVILLAGDDIQAKDYGYEVRRRYAMWFSRRYRERILYHDNCVDVRLLDTYWYVRNAIAYVFRNALDNGKSIESYPWSGYRAVFCNGQSKVWTRTVSTLTKRERETTFHTNDDISSSGWLIDANGYLEPASTCDWQYVEAVFNNSQAFLLKTIGEVNVSQMQQELVDRPRIRMLDTDFFKMISSISERWYSKPVSQLSITEKMRMIPYVSRTTNTSIPQLARGFGLERDKIAEILNLNR